MIFFNTRAFGILSAVFAVSIWAFFLLVTRFAVSNDFTVEEVLILRLIPAALAMAPLMLKFDLIPRGQSWPRAIILMIGASAVFPYVVSSGLAYAPASDGGALAPGILPFWTALAAYVLAGERPDRVRKLGLGMILFGAMLVGLWQVLIGSSSGTWRGHLLFLCGSGFFAIYSVVFRQSGLTPIHGLIIGLFWGTLLVTPILFMTGNITFAKVDLLDVIIMSIMQSFVIGIFATIFYNYAVQLLGASESGAFGALTPIIALFGGMLMLNEVVSLVKIVGIILVASGVLLASGILKKSSNG